MPGSSWELFWRNYYEMDFKNGFRLLLKAAKNGNLTDLKDYLKNHPKCFVQNLLSSSCHVEKPIVIAAINGHLDVIEYILAKCNDECVLEQVGDVEFDGETIEGAPALWCAAAAGHLKIVRALVELGANVNSTTKSQSTPLGAACVEGHLEIVCYLVSAGADIEIANAYGDTCLIMACYRNRYEIVDFLLQQKADVNRKNMKG